MALRKTFIFNLNFYNKYRYTHELYCYSLYTNTHGSCFDTDLKKQTKQISLFTKISFQELPVLHEFSLQDLWRSSYTCPSQQNIFLYLIFLNRSVLIETDIEDNCFKLSSVKRSFTEYFQNYNHCL